MVFVILLSWHDSSMDTLQRMNTAPLATASMSDGPPWPQLQLKRGIVPYPVLPGPTSKSLPSSLQNDSDHGHDQQRETPPRILWFRSSNKTVPKSDAKSTTARDQKRRRRLQESIPGQENYGGRKGKPHHEQACIQG